MLITYKNELPISKLSDLLRFEKFEITIISLTLAREITITRSIFEIEGSSFGFSLLVMRSINHGYLGSMTNFDFFCF